MIWLWQESRIDLHRSVVMKPLYLPVWKLVSVESWKCCLQIRKLLRNFTIINRLLRPLTVCQYFCWKFDAVDGAWANHMPLEIISSMSAYDHILEHGLDLPDNILSTLNLQQLDHAVFSICRDSIFVKQSMSQQVLIRLNENISAIQATKQPDNLLLFFLNFWLLQRSKAFFEFVVDIYCQIIWNIILQIHKLLKWLIPCLFKVHILIETCFDNLVHFRFER